MQRGGGMKTGRSDPTDVLQRRDFLVRARPRVSPPRPRPSQLPRGRGRFGVLMSGVEGAGASLLSFPKCGVGAPGDTRDCLGGTWTNSVPSATHWLLCERETYKYPPSVSSRLFFDAMKFFLTKHGSKVNNFHQKLHSMIGTIHDVEES